MSDRPAVRYWTAAIPGDPNHVNRFAEVNGVLFYAYPHQPYHARVGDRAVLISLSHRSKGSWWMVNVRRCFANGQSEWIAGEKFPEDQKDAAFVWAAQQLQQEANDA